MTFTATNKSSSTFTSGTKNLTTFTNYFRHGKTKTIAELADFTFESVVFQDGTQLKDVTFEELTDTIWTSLTKN